MASPRAAKLFAKTGPESRADVAQLALLLVKEQQRLLVFDLLRVVVDHVVGVAVGQEQIERSVVIVVEEAQSPAAQEARCLRHLVLEGDVAEGLVLAVLVEREHLLIHVGDEEVLPAIAVEIGGIHAHAGAGAAILAESHFGRERDLFPLASGLWHPARG